MVMLYVMVVADSYCAMQAKLRSQAIRCTGLKLSARRVAGRFSALSERDLEFVRMAVMQSCV